MLGATKGEKQDSKLTGMNRYHGCYHSCWSKVYSSRCVTFHIKLRETLEVVWDERVDLVKLQLRATSHVKSIERIRNMN